MLDSSSDRPNAAQALTALESGIGAWGGYLVSASDDDVLAERDAGRGMFGLAAPWTIAEFRTVQTAGLQAVAFLSGLDTPAVATKARDFGLIPVLDDEDGIRARGPWEQLWLDLSGAGLYGLCAVHGLRAPRRIVARYPGFDPRAPWDLTCSAPPAEPHGWQWAGTAVDPVTGLNVDRSWLSDDFFTEVTMTPEEHAWLQAIYTTLFATTEQDPAGNLIPATTQLMYSWSYLRTNMPTILADLTAIRAAAGGTLTDDQARLLQETHDAVLRIEASLKGA